MHYRRTRACGGQVMLRGRRREVERHKRVLATAEFDTTTLPADLR